jgi:hypothetical protein
VRSSRLGFKRDSDKYASDALTGTRPVIATGSWGSRIFHWGVNDVLAAMRASILTGLEVSTAGLTI